MTKRKYRYAAGVLTLLLSMVLVSACGKEVENKDDTQNPPVTENDPQSPDNTDSPDEEEEPDKEDNKPQQGEKEVPIYSINDDSMESQQTYVTMEKITPEAVVEAVVDSFAEHSLEIGIESITTDGDTVIVSFLYGKAPLTSVGSTVEETILNSIADSLLDNIDGCKKIIFRAEGEAYESGHYAFGVDEVYAAQ